MLRKSDPWYIHAALYFVIVVLSYILLRVAIIDPSETVKIETFNKNESRARMINIRQAQIYWEQKYGQFSDRLDSLIYFIQTDEKVVGLVEGTDSITGKSTNPFISLAVGSFVPDSLFITPKSHRPYQLSIDTVVSIDSVNNTRGVFLRVDTTIVIGEHYYLFDPDGYGTIGDSIFSNAMKNTATWE